MSWYGLAWWNSILDTAVMETLKKTNFSVCVGDSSSDMCAFDATKRAGEQEVFAVNDKQLNTVFGQVVARL